jgi:hypothetical protein
VGIEKKSGSIEKRRDCHWAGFKLFLKCCLQLKTAVFIKDAHGLAIPKRSDKEKAEPDDGG